MNGWTHRLSNPLMSADNKTSCLSPSWKCWCFLPAGQIFCPCDFGLPESPFKGSHETELRKALLQNLGSYCSSSMIRCTPFLTSFQKSLFLPLQNPRESPLKLRHLLFHSGSLGIRKLVRLFLLPRIPSFPYTVCSHPKSSCKSLHPWKSITFSNLPLSVPRFQGKQSPLERSGLPPPEAQPAAAALVKGN